MKLYFQNNSTKKEEQYEIDTLFLEIEDRKLILWNDDFNTFDFVIDCLVEICGHTPEQAEQCTILVHYKGKCTVKQAPLKIIEPMYQKLLRRGLSAEIF